MIDKNKRSESDWHGITENDKIKNIDNKGRKIRMRLLGETKKKYINALELIERKKLSNIRKRIKILVVDDESDDIYNILKERQYDVYYKNDMNYAVEAEPFEIIVMDIKGVAKRLQSSMEGFSLACEVKHKYPLKRVCCYSGSIHAEISEQLADKKTDAFFQKG